MSSKKVLLIGWDAADWRIISPMMDEGKLPHLSRFVEEGVMGNLATLNPILSPMLWTSIATGKRPYKHGIHGFTEPDPETGTIRPISGASRTTKAVWNILNQTGRRSNVVGWWPSHPAEPIQGAMVSNLYAQTSTRQGKKGRMPPGCVSPARLHDNLAALRMYPEDVQGGHLLSFVPRAEEIDQSKDRRLFSIAKILSACTSVHAAATALIQLEPWDFMAVYYDAIDHFGHGFMKYHPPKQSWIPEKDFELYGGVIEAAYRFHDMMLGTLLHLAGEDTTVILMSDHGFHPDHLRPDGLPVEPAGPAAEHRSYGILAVRGPGIRNDERVYGANLLDICPTILTAFEEPVGQDMDGRPLMDIFESPPDLKVIESWDPLDGDHGMHPPDMRIRPEEAQEAVEQLVELGYIEEPDEDERSARRKTQQELDYNLACAYMDGNLHAYALPLLKTMFNEDPDDYRFGLKLVAVCEALGRLNEARQVLEKTFEHRIQNAERARMALKEEARKKKEESENDSEGFNKLSESARRRLRKLKAEAKPQKYVFAFYRGSLDLTEKNYHQALEHFTEACDLHPGDPGILHRIGFCHVKLRAWSDAETAFMQALQADPDHAPSYQSLAQSLLGQSRNHEAAQAAMKACGLQFHNPYSHYLVGVAMRRLGYPLRAAEAIRIATVQNPNFAAAHRLLSRLYTGPLKDQQLATRHRELAKKARNKVKDLRHRTLDPLVAQHAMHEEGAPRSQLIGADEKPADPGRDILVVSGLPRSGTSLMMQMLRAGSIPLLTDQKRSPDEQNPEGYFEYDPVRSMRKSVDFLPEARGGAVKIIAHLLRHLPSDETFRVIFMERHLDEIIQSQVRMLKAQGKDTAVISSERIQQTFQRQLNNIKRYLVLREIPVLYIPHQDCLHCPERVVQRLIEFTGRGLPIDTMTQVVNPALYRQRVNTATHS